MQHLAEAAKDSVLQRIRPHPQQISEDTARYYGDKYTLTFGLDTQGISVDGCDDIIGSDAFFIYEEWLDDGEN